VEQDFLQEIFIQNFKECVSDQLITSLSLEKN